MEAEREKGWMDGGWIEEGADGWRDEWVDGQMDRWTDGQMALRALAHRCLAEGGNLGVCCAQSTQGATCFLPPAPPAQRCRGIPTFY